MCDRLVAWRGTERLALGMRDMEELLVHVAEKIACGDLSFYRIFSSWTAFKRMNLVFFWE